MKKLIMILCIISVTTTILFAKNPRNDWSLLPDFVWDNPVQVYGSGVLLPFKEMLGDWIDTAQEKLRYHGILITPTVIKKRYTNVFIVNNMFVVGYEEYKYEEDKKPEDMIVVKRVLLTFDFDYSHKVSLLMNVTLMDFERRTFDVVEDASLIRYQLKLLGINGA